ncbi:MAG: AzlC family ABC transporter permease [Peptococcaceae bacterium]|nr:AzlC family ABC transporter permease [Peptococcaceae bacterium]
MPVLLGYVFLGMAFGLLLQQAGYGLIWSFLASLLVYGGTIQFLMIDFLTGGVGLTTAAAMTLLVNGRHAFYGLSFIRRFKQMGRAYPYMIFSLTDETYSLLCAENPPAELNADRVLFLIALFDQLYWLAGSVLGGLLGPLIPFNTKGIDFAMTALFTVIFVEQWLESRNRLPALTGLVSGMLCLAVFGPANFILPSLAVTVGILLGMKGYYLKEEEKEGEA